MRRGGLVYRASKASQEGGGGALLERRGEGGRVSRGGTPPARMNHINQELQKHTTLTHSAYTFVTMSGHGYSNHLLGSIHCALT